MLGLNIHARNIPDMPRLTRHLQATRPRAVVVMDDHGVALQIKRLLPETMVIYRQWGPDGDENDYLQEKPRGWLESHKQYAVEGVALYVLNEPPFDKQVMDWLTELVKLNAAEYRFTLVIGNWATGNPTGNNIVAAWKQARDLLVVCDQHRDITILGLHQYAGGVITSGLYGGNPDKAGKDGFNLIPRGNWPNDMAGVTCFHVGREMFLLLACQEMGIKPPRVILTEFQFDDLGDIKPWLEALPKTPPFTGISGHKSLRGVWATWWPQWSFARACFEQIKYALTVILGASIVEAVCWFCWGHSSDRWIPFDRADDEELNRLIEADAQTTLPPAPPPSLVPFPADDDPRWRDTTLTSRGGPANLRAQPSVASMALRTFVLEDALVILYDQLKAGEQHKDALNGGFGFWAPVRLVTGKQGWVRSDAVIEDVVHIPVVDEPPAFDFGDLLAKLRQDLESLDVNIRSKAAQVDDASHVYARLDAELKLLETTRADIAEVVAALEKYQPSMLELA